MRALLKFPQYLFHFLTNFVILDDSYGYNSISVAPYATASKSWVLFADRNNIDDIVDSYFAVIKNGHWQKPVYNIGHHNLSKIEVAKAIKSVIDCEIEMIGDLGDLRNLQIDSSAFFKDFDWKPKHDFEYTIKKTERWIRKNLKEIEKTNFVLNVELAFSWQNTKIG